MYTEKTEEQKRLDRIKRFGIIESKVENQRPTYKSVLLQNYNNEKYSEEAKKEHEESKLLTHYKENKINPEDENLEIEKKKVNIFLFTFKVTYLWSQSNDNSRY